MIGVTPGSTANRASERFFDLPRRRNDRTRFPKPGIVDGLVFLLLLSGPPQMRVRDAAASLRGEADAAVFLRLAVWGCGLLWIFVRLYPIVKRGLFPKVGTPQLLGGMLVLVLAAGIWVAPGPLLTAFSVYQLAIMLAFSWIFVQRYGPDTCIRYLFWGYLLLAIAIAASWMLSPELVVRRGRVRGDLIAPAGAVAALGLLLCLSGALRVRRWILIPATALFSVVLFAAQTRTAITAFVVSMFLVVVFRYSAPMKRALPIVLIALLVGGILDVLSIGQRYVVREQQSLATMSDRIPLWNHLVGTMLRESPAVGLGYVSASRVLGPEYNPRLGNAHSAFVEVLVGGGLLGGLLFFTLYVTLLLYGVRLLVRGRDSPRVYAALGLFAITFAMSVTITDGVQGGPVGFTFWSLTALLPAVWKQTRRTEGIA